MLHQTKKPTWVTLSEFDQLNDPTCVGAVSEEDAARIRRVDPVPVIGHPFRDFYEQQGTTAKGGEFI